MGSGELLRIDRSMTVAIVRGIGFQPVNVFEIRQAGSLSHDTYLFASPYQE
jgi:hypothetical protein